MKNLNILKWALVAGIVIVLNLFINFSIQLVYQMPEFETFCPQKQVNVMPDSEQACVAVGGQWNANNYYSGETKLMVATAPEMRGYCDINFTCQKDYQTALEQYNRNVFIILVAAGVIALVASFFLANTPAVSLGLSLGGVLSLIIGTIRYWTNMDDYLRVIILGTALVALIWLGVKKIKE
ncbi:MAG: hypothetical protein HYV76_01705 [Candidatus Vogelbacteria bacterium]|nr:hypothetical protein [Candidatus Vogelbacteria bacterium]